MQHRIFIDLTNLITYAAHFNKISGVQRVEIELIKSIASHQNAIGMMNIFDGDSTELIDRMTSLITHDEAILPFLKKEFSYLYSPSHCSPYERLGFFECAFRNIRGPLKRRSLKLGPGDLVFLPGGFGFACKVLKAYRKMAARGVRLVFLIHDVFPITQPDLTAPGAAGFFAPAFHLPADIITTTSFNAAEFTRAYETVMNKACGTVPHVIPLAHEFPGVARDAKPGQPSPRLHERLAGRPFVVSIGTVEVRKNHLALLHTWRALKQEMGESLPLLVIAGRRGWHAEATLGLLDQARENDAPYLFIEEPSDDELKWLYASCTFSVLPSLFEGWGLPIGESLWFGKACAAAKTSSMPEVGRDLCVYFDPDNEEDIKAAIRQFLDPAIRKIFEDKIRTADLRLWADVARDLIAALLKTADAPKPA